MDYKLKIQTMNNLLDKLEDYYLTLIEVSRELNEQRKNLSIAIEGEYGDKVSTTINEGNDYVVDVIEYIKELYNNIDDYIYEVSEVLKPKSPSSWTELNYDEFIIYLKKYRDKLIEIQTWMRNYTSDEICKEADKMINTMKKELLEAKHKKDEKRINKLRCEIDEVKQNRKIYVTLISTINGVDFNSTIDIIEDILVKFESLDGIERDYVFKLRNIEVLPPIELINKKSGGSYNPTNILKGTLLTTKEMIIPKIELSEELKQYLNSLAWSLVDEENQYRIFSLFTEASDELHEEFVEKVFLSRPSLTVEQFLKGVGPFSGIDIVYIVWHLAQGKLGEVFGDVGSALGGYAAGVYGFSCGGPVGFYLFSAYGSIKGEMIFEHLYDRMIEKMEEIYIEVQEHISITYEEFKTDYVEYNNQMKNFSKLEQEYRSIYDDQKLDETKEKMHQMILEGQVKLDENTKKVN